VSSQPNRKQQRLARDLSKQEGIPYQAALAQIQTTAREAHTQDDGAVLGPQRRMLEVIYETFATTGQWPTFQYVGVQLWGESQVEPRELYLDLAERGLVSPAMARSHHFQLRDNTSVGVSLHGLMHLRQAGEDLGRFVSVVRYVSDRAGRFRPSSPTELGRLSVTSEEVRLHLGLEQGDAALLRLGTLVSGEAWQLWTSFAGPGPDGWSFEVNLERARRYRDIHTVIDFLEISYPKQESSPGVGVALPAEDLQQRDESSPHGDGAADAIDLFISHAGEDKDMVARPLAKALEARGWSVWLDELELIIGDSLSGGIDAALARSRFGVVVLSPSFFAKQWPLRELAGLAAREVDAGSKVILPVWHNVDERYIATRSPILADRVGASTSRGIEQVADELSTALARAGVRAVDGLGQETVVQAVESNKDVSRLTIPSTAEQQARLVAERPQFWEYRLFAGVLLQGKNDLETKWDDHALRLPAGVRREVDQASAPDFLSREMEWIGKRVGVLERILAPSVQEQAFGADDEEADPVRIANLARRIVTMYESLLDWAASLRNTSVPRIFNELLETSACFVDTPIIEIREFIDKTADQTSRLPELSAGATVENPATIELTLKLTVDSAIQERRDKAQKQIERELAKK
jgi:hypothetical protein